MTQRGRLWAACLTAASASAAASFAAGPPATEYADLRLPSGYPGDGTVPGTFPQPGSGNLAPGGAGGAGGFGRTPAPEPSGASPIVGFPSLGRPEPRPVGRQGAVREYARPAATGWVALVGEFKKPGGYEIAGTGTALPELLGRCDGLTAHATQTLRLVRNARAATVIHAGSEAPAVLRPGDVLVAEGRGDRRYGVVATSYEDRRKPAAPRPNVQLGIVGLSDRPVAVKVPGAYATVEGVLALSRQTHLAPRDVTVLVGGGRKVAGDQVTELTHGSVLLFDRRDVAAEAVGELPTNYYPLQPPPAGLPAAPEAPGLSADPAPSETVLTSAPGFGVPSPQALRPARTAEAMSLVPPLPAGDEGLSALPEVEALDPPADEPPLGFPRTADASGSVPVGRPEIAEPHITAVPVESIYGPAVPRIATADAAPAPPIPSDPPRLASPLVPSGSLGLAGPTGTTAAESTAEEELSFGSLAATVLIGGALGAITFVTLRKLRGRRPIGSLIGRLRTRIGVRAEAAMAERPEITRGTAPSNLLAALVADRLAFREEPIELPAVLRVFGRSSALKRRRIDPAAAGVPEPHIPLATPVEPAVGETTAAAKQPAAAKTNVRIDEAEPRSAPAGLAGGTPFERALAARRRTAARQ